MNRPLRAIRIVAVLGCCALAGLYAGQWFFQAPEPPPSPPPPPTMAGGEPALIDQLPAFSLMDLDGRNRAIQEWADTPLLINFWATWCAPCRKEMPLLQTLHEESPGGLQVIGIAVDRLADVESFIAETGVTYPILVGQNDAIAAAESFGPDFIALPFSVLVSADGSVIGVEAGELDPEELRGLAALAADLAAGSLSVAEARERFPGG